MKQLKRGIVFTAIAVLLGTLTVGCGSAAPTRFQYTYTDCFDTVTTFVLYDTDKETADTWSTALYERLTRFHRDYTIYTAYDGIPHNLYDVNQKAGQTVSVSADTIAMLTFAKDAYAKTDGLVNVAMGSVLKYWHDARLHETLPQIADLQVAAQHTSIENVTIDPQNGTVTLRDPAMSLDVGAIAKGYAVQRLAEYAKTLGVTSALISVGGNVVAVGDKAGAPFTIGIENPHGSDDYAARVEIRDKAVVTSGNYQRFFTVDGVRYHHLIHPDTLYPADFVASVSVIGDDSGVADMLSTALFLQTPENGKKLLSSFDGYEALWILQDGTKLQSDGFDAYLVK